MFNKTRSNTASSSLQIYIKPLSLIDPISGTIQAGIEKPITSHFAFAIDYGLRFSLLSKYYKGSERRAYRYTKLSGEIKYFFRGNRRRKHTGAYYLAVRGSYFPQTYRKENDFVQLDSTSYMYDYSNIKRNVWTADIISGHEFSGKRFVYNPYVGLGVRSLSIHHQPHNLTPGYQPSPADWDFSSHIDRQQGTFYRPDFCFGFRLGYRLGKLK